MAEVGEEEPFKTNKNTGIGNRFAKNNTRQGTLHATSISSVQGAKVIKDFEEAKKIFKKIDAKGRHTKGFVPYLSELLGIKQNQKNASKKYRTFKLDNGTILTVRLGGHNTSVHTYDDNGESNALSIVISSKTNRGIKNDGYVVLVEIKNSNNNFVAVLQAENHNRRGGKTITINNITTLYPKKVKGIVYWFNNDRATNIDKKKTLLCLCNSVPMTETSLKKNFLIL